MTQLQAHFIFVFADQNINQPPAAKSCSRRLVFTNPARKRIVSLSDERVREEYREVQSSFRLFRSRTPSKYSDAQSVRPVPLTHNPQQQPKSDVKDEGFDLQLPFPVTMPPISSRMITRVTPPHVARNSIAAVSLTAAGRRPLVIKLEQYAPPSPTLANFTSRVSIYIKRCLSSLHDVSSPPALHGVSGTVTFAA